MHKSTGILHITPPADTPLKIVGAHEAPVGKHFPAHYHETWELVYYRAGAILCRVGEEEYRSEPGLLLLTPPHIYHSEQAVTAYANYYICIDVPAQYPWPRVVLDDQKRTFGTIFEALVYEWHRQAPEKEQLLAALVSQLDIQLRRMHASQDISPEERVVRHAESLIAERFHSACTITEIAQEIGVSTSYLRAQFARLRGQSPMEMLQALRLQEALRLLQTSSSDLESIASMCGYHSASHMSRYTRRATGKNTSMLRHTAPHTKDPA